MNRIVNQLPLWRLILLAPIVLLLRLWTASLRIKISQNDRKTLEDHIGPLIFAFWHNKLFVAHELHKRFRNRKIYGLVSASKDGAWLAAIFKLMRIGAIRGSSSWRGQQALKELIEAVRSGCDIAITPDGPKGPRYVMKKGVTEIVKQTAVPCFFVNIEFSSYWELNSWDAFCIPKPFSTLTVSLNLLDNDQNIIKN